MTKLENNSSYGYDNISNKLIKSVGHILVKPLTNCESEFAYMHISLPTKIITG